MGKIAFIPLIRTVFVSCIMEDFNGLLVYIYIKQA